MKKKKWIILAAAALFLIVVSVFVIRINTIYPQKEEIIYGMNEDIPYGDDVYIRVNEAKFLSKEEADRIYREEQGKNPNPDETYDGYKYLAVSVTSVNRGTEEKRLELYPIVMQSGPYANGINMIAVLVYNEEPEKRTLQPKVGPGEEMTTWIVYTMYDIHFWPEDWKHVTEREFKLVFNLYPQKESILLSPNK